MSAENAAQVEVSKLDVADLGETKQIIAMAEKMAPVGGIFHLAMILQDRWMSNQVHPLPIGCHTIPLHVENDFCC